MSAKRDVVDDIAKDIDDQIDALTDLDSDEDEDALPITENAYCELHIGHDIIVNGGVYKIYAKWGDRALPGENDLLHVGRVQEIAANTYLNWAARVRAIAASENTTNKPSR